MRRRDVGRGRRLRPRVTRPSGSGGRGRIRSAPGVFGRGPSDPTAPHYDGAAEKAGSGSGEDRRVRPATGPKALAGPGPAPETRPPTRADGFDLKIAERSGALRTRG